jgi:hypothetical protein
LKIQRAKIIIAPIPDKTRYLHYDNLGSIDTITDGQGDIVERMAYTAFGQRRKGDWRASDPLLPIIPALTNRGFTGHEHILMKWALFI